MTDSPRKRGRHDTSIGLRPCSLTSSKMESALPRSLGKHLEEPVRPRLWTVQILSGFLGMLPADIASEIDIPTTARVPNPDRFVTGRFAVVSLAADSRPASHQPSISPWPLRGHSQRISITSGRLESPDVPLSSKFPANEAESGPSGYQSARPERPRKRHSRLEPGSPEADARSGRQASSSGWLRSIAAPRPRVRACPPSA